MVTEFCCGHTSTSDAKRSPKEVVTPEIVDKIYGMILDSQGIKVREVAEAHKLGYKLLPYYYYFPFPDLKKWLGSKRFGCNEEVITETNAYFESPSKKFIIRKE